MQQSDDINTKLCKLLGIDMKNVSEVYVHIKANELPKVAIIKYLHETTDKQQTTMFRLVPID
jgi:hypothetical protein